MDEGITRIEPYDVTIVELAEASGYGPEWISDEIINSMAALGIMIMEEEDPDAPGITFTTEDDIGEIEISVRQVRSADKSKSKKYLH